MSNRLATKEIPASARMAYRTDIEGLRAVAVLGVVLYHASVPFFGGGFVGVDVFFVISGFLITGLLLREYETNGRIGLGAFYARRAKRLLPPAGIVVAVTAVGLWFTVPLLTVFTASFDLLSAVFYVANWRFIAKGNDYLAESGDQSVALHFWSLAVEEQFYLVWPAVVIATLWIAHRRGWSLRVTTGVVIAGVSVASLGSSVWLTYGNDALAYMATYTRAWQFGAGALVAVAAPWLASRPGLLGRIGWAGLAAIAFAFISFDGSTPYPGWAALVPTAGAAAILLSTESSYARRALSALLLRTIGRWSYPWYLWHWPMLILAEAKFGPQQWPVKLLIAAIALGAAALTNVVIERPLASSDELKRKVTAAAAVGLAATVLACSAVMTVGTKAVNALGTTTASPSSSTFEEVFGRPTGIESGPVNPAPLKARGDIPDRTDCLLDRTAHQPDCEFGVTGGRRVVLFGDSHAHQWLSALDDIARQRDWQLTVVTQSGCPVPDIARRSDETARFSQDYCSTWRASQIDRIVKMAPSTIIVSTLNYYIPQQQELFDDWRASIDALGKSGADIVYIRDTPYPKRDIPACVSSAIDDWSRCAFEPSDRIDPVIAGSLRGQLPGVKIVDLNGYLCERSSCAAVRNGTLLYRDDSHLSDTAVKLLTPALAAALSDEGIR